MADLWRSLFAHVTITVLLVGSLAAASQPNNSAVQDSPVLGSGKGIDHVGIAVHDLEEARRVYGEVLGFKVFPGGSFPGGVRNSAIGFKTNYLELITVDPAKVAGDKDAADLANFLQKREGAAFLGLQVSSVQQTADFLRSRGFDITGPSGSSYTPEGSKEVQTALWQTVSFKRPVVPADAIFFIHYVPRPADAPKRTPREHPNTAQRIWAVWMAVKDLDAATRAYDSIGLRAGRKLKVSQLKAEGREIEAGKGIILLLQSRDKKRAVSSYLAQGGEGIMGVSIEVSNLETARHLLETSTKREFKSYNGLYGNSILVPPELTHGVWIELFQK